MGLREVVLIGKYSQDALVCGVAHCAARCPEIGRVRQEVRRVPLYVDATVLVRAGRALERLWFAVGGLLGQIPAGISAFENFDGYRSARESSPLERAPVQRRVGSNRDVNDLVTRERARRQGTTGTEFHGYGGIGESRGAGVRREHADDDGSDKEHRTEDLNDQGESLP